MYTAFLFLVSLATALPSGTAHGGGGHPDKPTPCPYIISNFSAAKGHLSGYCRYVPSRTPVYIYQQIGT